MKKIEIAKRRRKTSRAVSGKVKRAAARKWLAKLRKRGARITGDIISPSGDVWDAER